MRLDYNFVLNYLRDPYSQTLQIMSRLSIASQQRHLIIHSNIQSNIMAISYKLIYKDHCVGGLC